MQVESSLKCLCSAGLRPDAGASLRGLHGEVSTGTSLSSEGEIWCLCLSGEMKGGEPVSHLYFQPLKLYTEALLQMKCKDSL